MMPDFKATDVDSTQIDNASVYIADEIAELRSVCAFIKDDVMAGLDPYWQGQAKKRFDEQFLPFAESLIKLVDKYEALDEQLKAAGVTYGKADDSVKQLVARLPK